MNKNSKLIFLLHRECDQQRSKIKRTGQWRWGGDFWLWRLYISVSELTRFGEKIHWSTSRTHTWAVLAWVWTNIWTKSKSSLHFSLSAVSRYMLYHRNILTSRLSFIVTNVLVSLRIFVIFLFFVMGCIASQHRLTLFGRNSGFHSSLSRNLPLRIFPSLPLISFFQSQEDWYVDGR